jgi:endoglucanase
MNKLPVGLNILLLLLVLSASCSQPPAVLAPTPQAPAATATANWAAGLRYPRLARGVNLTGWFWYAPQGDEAIRARFSDDEFRALRQMGMTYVRLPIDLGFLLDETSPDMLNAHNLALVDEAIRRLTAADLAVIVDLHSTSISDSNAANYSKGLENADYAVLFVRWWEFFAAHLSQYDPAMVILGPMNEPVFMDNTAVWNRIQVKLVKAIRAKAPNHTIVAVGAKWSSLDSLVSLAPLDDNNLVYDFHFYEPFPFTHQGATWSSKELVPLRNVPYPSSPEGVAAQAAALSDAAARQTLTQYGNERWDVTTLQKRLQRVADWAKKNNAAVICAEFGVLRDFAPSADRVRWLEDTRSILESGGIGWALWDYDMNFGLAERSGATVKRDPAVVKALGLNPVP